MKHLLIRADASMEMGTGHVMRCLALAQAWQDKGGAVTLASSALPASMVPLLARNGIQHVPVVSPSASQADADETRALHSSLQAHWLVVDGYHFDDQYQSNVRQINGCLLTIDDLGHLSRYVADLVLNQNITAGHDLYPTRSITTDLLFGGRYALLRREFQTPPEQGSSQTSDSKNILVMMGGSDPHNTAAKVAHALFHVPGIHARIIAGALNPHLPTLHQLAAESQGKIEVLVNVQDMVAQMDWANLAVSAGGTSVLELASRQVPTLLLSIADNQRAISAALHEHHVMTHLGWYESTDESTITEAIKEHLLGPLSTRKKQEDTRKRCKELCDGQGAARVVRHMTELDSQSQHREISFWPASMEDRTLVYQWAQDPVSRQASFESASIPWEDHCAWFERKLADSASALWICRSTDNKALSVVRFDELCDDAVISINIAPDCRGCGLGSKIVSAACEVAFKTLRLRTIKAFIKNSNKASLRIFEKSGFSPSADTEAPAGARCFMRRNDANAEQVVDNQTPLP